MSSKLISLNKELLIKRRKYSNLLNYIPVLHKAILDYLKCSKLSEHKTAYKE